MRDFVLSEARCVVVILAFQHLIGELSCLLKFLFPNLIYY